MANRPGLLAIVFIGALMLSFFGFDTSSSELKNSNRIRSKNLEITGIENLILSGKKKLDKVQKAELVELEEILNHADSETTKTETYKKLSGLWYRIGDFALAGAFAKKVAESEKSEEAWSIVGTTYLEGLNHDLDDKSKLFCRQGAEEAFINASSLNPNEPRHKLNQALCYVKMPGENPMQGIQMMLELEKHFPDYRPLQLTLTQLAIQTGQWEKAKKRLLRILEGEPENSDANCLMVEVLNGLSDQQGMEIYKKNCKKL
ncbi:MAG: hypothetical protein M3Q56_00950 [Bacteroidota bacterium]|nr:hypothetical protein [Bacteroidota bacterium]